MQMIPTDCQHFNSCSAPLCPLDAESPENYYFYPGEEICKNQTVNRKKWILHQRLITRKVQNRETYYTLKMLKHHCSIYQGTVGIDPDYDEEHRENQEYLWLMKHTARKLTDQQKADSIEILRLARLKKKSAGGVILKKKDTRAHVNPTHSIENGIQIPSKQKELFPTVEQTEKGK